MYRTLDVLEELGLVGHGHGADGRGEYLVRPADEHGHLYCAGCRRQWELSDPQVRRFVSQIERQNRFSVDLSHLTWVGRGVDCGAAEPGLVTLPKGVAPAGQSPPDSADLLRCLD